LKLQKQLSNKIKGKEYPKWVIVIPPEKIEETGWKEGLELDVIVKNGKIMITKKEN
jgi:hypothetical protein